MRFCSPVPQLMVHMEAQLRNPALLYQQSYKYLLRTEVKWEGLSDPSYACV